MKRETGFVRNIQERAANALWDIKEKASGIKYGNEARNSLLKAEDSLDLLLDMDLYNKIIDSKSRDIYLRYARRITDLVEVESLKGENEGVSEKVSPTQAKEILKQLEQLKTENPNKRILYVGSERINRRVENQDQIPNNNPMLNAVRKLPPETALLQSLERELQWTTLLKREEKFFVKKSEIGGSETDDNHHIFIAADIL